MNWRSALRAPADMDHFTEILAQAWREHPAVAEVSIIEPLRLRVTRKANAAPCYASLESLWHDLQTDREMPLAWRVQSYIQDSLASWETVLTIVPGDWSCIFPTLATSEWCRQRKAEGFSPVSEPLIGDLHLTYMINDGFAEALLQTQIRSALGLPTGSLRALSLANLGRRYGSRPLWFDHGQSVYALMVGNSAYGNALLADEGVSEGMQQTLKTNRLMAAVPCCSAIFFADANQRDSVQTFLRKVASVYESEPEPISQAVFVRQHGVWEPETGPL